MNYYINKKIFGKNFKFICSESLYEIVRNSIFLYHDIPEEKTDVVIEITNKQLVFKCNEFSRNPSIHLKFENGMITCFGKHQIFWERDGDGLLNIKVYYCKRSGFFDYLKKLASIEYSTEEEVFIQFLHELVLVPATYFFDDLMPIHAASVEIDGVCILLAGTGGVGKSSTMLVTRKTKNASFLADDIVMLSNTGNVYGNMAWPKIYGYNCKGTGIAEIILAERSLFDKIHFHVKNRIDSKSVRRKINPTKIYSNIKTEASKIDTILYLVREPVSNITTSLIEKEKVIQMTLDVMMSEYYVFHNHLYWERYNAIATGSATTLDIYQVIQNWEKLLSKGLDCVQLIKVSIPNNMKHMDYLQQISRIIIEITTSDGRLR